MEETRRFVRKVSPFDDIEVEVVLQEVICGHDNFPAPYIDIYPLADWIEDGWVRLSVMSLYHCIPIEWRAQIERSRLRDMASGGPAHKSLCALAAAYLIFSGKEILIDGASSCSYAGGWADVATTDGSFYVECGALNTRKPIDAMLAGQTLFVLPYTLGCAMPNCDVLERLDPFPERGDDVLRLGRIQLAYLFEPKCKLKRGEA
jgi:hypothetical protein